MLIQLKQNEIIAALKNHISHQGFNIKGKDITVTFTAGRREAGITADISIEEADFPDFGEVEVPALQLVQTNKDEVVQEDVPEHETQSQATGTDDVPFDVDEKPEEEPAPVKPATTSLFAPR